MSIKLGTNTINKMYLGSTEIKKAYLGSTLIYDKTATPNGLLNNLVSYYKMDTNGSFPDAHGSNNGTINGATYTASGKINGGYSFDGVNDNVNIGTQLVSGLTNASVTAWVKVNSFTNDGQCYIGEYNASGDRALAMDTLNTNKFRFLAGDSSNNLAIITSPSTYSTDTYYLLGFTYDNGDVRVYINGNEVANDLTTLSGTLDNCTENFFFGCRKSGVENFDGVLDESGVWNRTLTPTEMTALYNSGFGLPYSSFTT